MAPRRTVIEEVSIPSSSGHQFTDKESESLAVTDERVSIPSSSGHQFTELYKRFWTMQERLSFNPFFIRASVYWISCQKIWRDYRRRFNPFFIRASVYCRSTGRSAATTAPCFNPFFIRASVYWRQQPENCIWIWCKVSIPSSSGHQFTAFLWTRTRFSSNWRFNPFFIRASVYWSKRTACAVATKYGFNPFFIRASVYW